MNILCTTIKMFPLVICGFYFISFSQTSGNFVSDSGWNPLRTYEGGEAYLKIEGSVCILTVTRPGREFWSVQLTQSHIMLQRNAAYVLSFDVSASLDRTVEVTVSRDGGDYCTYSGKDTVPISPTRRRYSKRFIMKQETDSEARIEINCGKSEGTIAIRNISLVPFTDKVLEMESPKGNECIPAGMPYPITWSSVNLPGHLSILFTKDNGATWKEIAAVAPDSSPFIWIPEGNYSPWCRIRIFCIDSPLITAENKDPFEIAPQRELVKNGSFADSLEGWSLNVTDKKVEHSISTYGGYAISILEEGDEDQDIQLIQDHLVLITGVTYRYSFIASQQDASVIDVTIGRSQDPYTSYVASAERRVQLSSSLRRYSMVFTMNAPTDSNARIELNCGRARGTFYINEVSIMPEYIVPVTGQSAHRSSFGIVAPSMAVTMHYPMTGRSIECTTMYPGDKVFDLNGRIRYTERMRINALSCFDHRCTASGAYIVKRINRKNRPDRESNYYRLRR